MKSLTTPRLIAAALLGSWLSLSVHAEEDPKELQASMYRAARHAIVGVAQKVDETLTNEGNGRVYKIQVHVEEMIKGDEFAAGDEIEVTAWEVWNIYGADPASVHGHKNIPKKGERRVYFLRGRGGDYAPVRLEGIQLRNLIDKEDMTLEAFPLQSVEMMYKAFADMAEKHQGEVRVQVTGIEEKVEWMHNPMLSMPSQRKVKTYLAFTIQEVISGPLKLETPPQSRLMLLEEKVEGIRSNPVGPGPERYGFTGGQIINLRYVIGLEGAEAGLANAKPAYQFSKIEE